MKMLSTLFFSAITLAAAAGFAKPTGLSMKPVISVTSSGGVTTILGNMPLPPEVPPDARQQNAAVFPDSADTIGCAAVAQSAIASGKAFTIIGNQVGLGAVKGVFTMEFDSLTSCK